MTYFNPVVKNEAQLLWFSVKTLNLCIFIKLIFSLLIFLQMMTKITSNLFFSFLFFSFVSVQAQSNFILKEIKLDSKTQEKIRSDVEQYETYELDLSVVDRYLKSSNSTANIPLKITIAPNRTLELNVVENEIRAPNYAYYAVKKTEIELLSNKGRCDTYKSSEATNGVHSSLFVSKKYFSLDYVENGERMSLVSLSRFMNVDSFQRLKNIVVLFKESNLKKNPIQCSSTEVDAPNITLPNANKPETAVRFLELAVVADNEFYNLHGSSTENYIRGLINTVSLRYEDDFQLKMFIVHYEEFVSIPSNYPFSGNLKNRWDQVRSYFNPISPTNPQNGYAGLRKCVTRDLVHLFTYNLGDVAGTTQGNSQYGVSSICGTDDDIYLSGGPGFCDDRTGFAYSASNGWALNWTTTAHEIGHNFGAGHTDCGIMCPSFCNCSQGQFSPTSFSRINGHIYGVGLIPLACPPHKKGACLLNIPIEPHQVSIIGDDIMCSSSTFRLNTNEWAVWSSDDPDVSLVPFGSVLDYSVTAYCNVTGYHTIKATFFHNCQLTVMYKLFWAGPPQQPTVYTQEDGCSNGHSTCRVLSFSFDKQNTRGLNDFSWTNTSCGYCNTYVTGSFEVGTISIWNLYPGECVNVTGTAYNECGTTDISQSYCNVQGPAREGDDITVKIYPNPVNSKLYMVSKNSGTFTIFNGLGQQLSTHIAEASSEIEVNAQTLPSGIYLVKFDSPESKVIKKITITH
jgi:hypothetical protein